MSYPKSLLVIQCQSLPAVFFGEMIPQRLQITNHLALRLFIHRPMHVEKTSDTNIRIKMPLLLQGRLSAKIGKQDPIDLFFRVITSAHVRSNVESWIPEPSVLPVNQMNLLIVNQEVLIAAVTMSQTLSYSILSCQII